MSVAAPCPDCLSPPVALDVRRDPVLEEDAVARGVGRWAALGPPALPGNASERDRLKDRLVRAACYYEIQPARAAAVASAKRVLDDLRGACDRTLLVKLVEEIESGLNDRTLRSPD